MLLLFLYMVDNYIHVPSMGSSILLEALQYFLFCVNIQERVVTSTFEIWYFDSFYITGKQYKNYMDYELEWEKDDFCIKYINKD